MDTYMDFKENGSEEIHYNDPEYPIYCQQGMLSFYPNYICPSHWHDEIELIYVTSGETIYNINGEVVQLKTGEGIFVNSRKMHFAYSEQKECEYLCILLHPMLLCSSMNMERDFIKPVIQNKNLNFLRLTTDVKWQADILDCVKVMYDQKNSLTFVLRTQSLFSDIWAILFENVPQERGETESNSIDLYILKNMIGFIRQYYHEKLTLAQIAEAGSVGQSKCCKLFKKYLSQSPNEYLTNYRLEKSMQLLQTSDLSITEIAFAVGFSGSSYFSETFRKCFGNSPKEYRKYWRK